MNIYIQNKRLLTEDDNLSHANLIDGSMDFSKGWQYDQQAAIFPKDVKDDIGNNVVQFQSSWKGIAKNVFVKAGDVVTWSSHIQSQNNGTNRFGLFFGDSKYNGTWVPQALYGFLDNKKLKITDNAWFEIADNEWHKVSATFKIVKSGMTNIRFEISNYFTFNQSSQKLEYGYRSTDWSYSQNDIRSLIERINMLENKIGGVNSFLFAIYPLKSEVA